MFIKNLKSGVIQECSNEDVIENCRKNPDEFAVAETAEELAGEAKKSKPADCAEESEAVETAEGTSEETPEAEDEAVEQESEETAEVATEEEIPNYSSMKVEELRKVAKEKGIQGYANMNKETLVAVIEAHE